MSANSPPQSTPHKPTSRTISSDTHTPASDRSQTELKTIMRDEIGQQAWQVDTIQISRMLSPRKPMPGKVDLGLLANYRCRVDESKFTQALEYANAQVPAFSPPGAPGERAHYAPFAAFLNDCIVKGSEALQKFNLMGSWYDELRFVKYDKVTGDRIEGAPALKPDLAGGNDLTSASDTILYWSPPSDLSKGSQIQIPVEVKDNWPDMVAQAATYARCLFCASPSRTFALVLAYHHTDRELRFLIFHRGGLTSHPAIKVTHASERAGALRLLMTILLWTEPQDAGFISTSNDFEYLLPRSLDMKQYILGTVMEILSNSTCVRGRATSVCRLICGPPKTPVANLQPSFVLRRSPRTKTSQPQPQPPSKPRGSKTKGTANAAGEEDAKGSNHDDKQKPDIFPRYIDPRRVIKWRAPEQSRFGKEERSLKEGQEVVLKFSWQVDSRKEMESTMFAAADGMFGTPNILCSYEGIHPTGEPVSNRLFLPKSDDMKTAHWKIFNKEAPSSVEAHTMCFTVFTLIGYSLVHAKSSSDLSEALVHALLGWLSLYQSGFLQRDISIGNVLLTEGESASKPFEITGDTLSVLWPLTEGSLDLTISALDSINIQDSGQPTSRSLAEEIKTLVKKFRVQTKCIAFVTDGDMAIDWRTYFNTRRGHGLETRSGTEQFMSLALQSANSSESPYLQSPLDDIESFFWLALWAILFNIHNKDRSSTEIHWRRVLHNGDFMGKSGLLTLMRLQVNGPEHSDIFCELLPLMKEWWRAQEALRDEWIVAMMQAPQVPQSQHRQFYLHHFHLYAMRGVKDALALMERHQERLQLCRPFVSK
ncbi:hypothetical protein B0H17DRAFT_174693 [Mycena rosella]|uniref:Fungal-type protein kinase domain-containing protein n=1 Tax=Mycena rosella TaxID=1033263 RepID=A0AAD7D0F3_MYCRO|nr:hypothetical protein B0H17DRAFT_174693 [Mycena rosella]